MSSLRESPIRRQPTSRPPWLIALLGVVGLLVVGAVIFGVVSLVRGATSTGADEPVATPTPCVTSTVTPAEVLPKPAKVKVNVYNATSTSGLASKTATSLEDRGFRVGKVANDPVGRSITGVAEIRFGPKGAEEAQLLLLYVPGSQLVELDRTGRQVDLAMGDAFAGLAPQDAVTAALASPSPVATGPGCPSPSVGGASSQEPAEG